MRLRLSIFIIALMMISSMALAAGHMEIREYVALRKKVAARVRLSAVQSDASTYIGKILEIRGKVVGLSTKEAGCSIIISTADGSVVVDSETQPSDKLGAELACLVQVGEGSTHSLSDLKLLYYAYDFQLKQLEDAWQADANRRTAENERRAKESAQRAATPTITRANQAATAKAISVEELVRAYKKAIRGFNRKLSDKEADTIARSILGFSSHYKLDPRLVCAVILAESHFKIEATSHCGAQGLGQLMPGTAAGMGVNNAYDPVANVYGSVRYIRSMMDRVTDKHKWNDMTWHDLGLALAAYNAGPGAVKRHGGIPPYRETQNYVKRVTAIYKKLCGV